MSEPLGAARSIVIRHGLLPTDSLDLDLAAWRSLHRWAVDEGLIGLLWAAVEDRAIGIGDDWRAACAESYNEALRTTLTCEAVAAETVDILSRNGVESWLLKGLGVAHLDYPHPGYRNSKDVDLLVRRTDLPDVARILPGHGFERAEPGLAPWWERRFGRAVVFHSAEGVELDLHTAFGVGYFGTKLDPNVVTSLPGAPFDLGGVPAQALAAPARLLSSCYSAVLGRGGQLRLLRDIGQQLLRTECDWQAAVDIAAIADGTVVVARGLQAMARTVGVDAAHPALAWAESVTPSAVARRALRYVERGESEGWSADMRSTLLALSPRDKATFLVGAAFPPRANRRFRNRTLVGQVRRLASLARVRSR